MKKVLPIICLLFLATMPACKDKNAKATDADITSLPIHGTSPTDPRSIASKLEQATSATIDKDGLVWASEKDLVCNMKVTQGDCDTLHYQGKIYGFCSESCKESFQENPQKFISKAEGH